MLIVINLLTCICLVISSGPISPVVTYTQDNWYPLDYIKNLEVVQESDSEKEQGFQKFNEYESKVTEASLCYRVKVVQILQSPGCQDKEITTFACAGTCPSYIQVSNSKLWTHERSCTCCEQTRLQQNTFVLDCPSLMPPYREIKSYVPMDCICRSCYEFTPDNIRPQEVVEALEGQSQ